MRLFIWSVPYLAIIPAITIFLIYQSQFILSKLAQITLLFLFLFHIFNFLSITPYHYTFLNYFSGKKDLRYQKFENDYWSTSLKELIYSSNLVGDNIKFSSCGVSPGIVKIYMKQRYERSEFTSIADASYIIMTNRAVSKIPNPTSRSELTNCFDKYSGNLCKP